jgi:hypothetical protein
MASQIPIDEDVLRRLVDLAQLGADTALETANASKSRPIAQRLLNEVQWLRNFRATLRKKGMENA